MIIRSSFILVALGFQIIPQMLKNRLINALEQEMFKSTNASLVRFGNLDEFAVQNFFVEFL
jgi:hypothetical protein